MPTCFLSQALTNAMALVLADEPCPEAALTAQILRSGGPDALSVTFPAPAWEGMIRDALEASDHPASSILLAAADHIPWGINPVAKSSVEGVYVVSTLLGPDGPVFCPDLRMGLLYQRPGSYYPLHSHLADETYTVIAGEALWTAGTDARIRRPGDMIHHPSLMPHAFRAGERGLLAVWRWSGDVGAESYKMLDDPACGNEAA